MAVIVCRWCGSHTDADTHNEKACYWEQQRIIYERGAKYARAQLAAARAAHTPTKETT